MAIRINPAVRLLWRSPTELQFGYPAQLTLTDIDREAEQLITALGRGISDRELDSQAAALGVSPRAITALISRLGPLLVADQRPDERVLELQFADIMRAALLGSENLDALLAARAERTVYLNRLGRFGLTAAHGLLASGIGAIVSDEPSNNSAQPHSTGGLTVFRELSLNQLRRVDFAVLQGHELVEPELYQRWLANDIAHIAVSFDEQGVTVSPPVTPGLTPCLACQSLQEIERDIAWSAIATQLSLKPRDLADAASAIFAAGVVTHRTLAQLDAAAQLRPSGETSGLRLTNSGEVLRLERAQTNCGCRLEAS